MKNETMTTVFNLDILSLAILFAAVAALAGWQMPMSKMDSNC